MVQPWFRALIQAGFSSHSVHVQSGFMFSLGSRSVWSTFSSLSVHVQPGFSPGSLRVQSVFIVSSARVQCTLSPCSVLVQSRFSLCVVHIQSKFSPDLASSPPGTAFFLSVSKAGTVLGKGAGSL